MSLTMSASSSKKLLVLGGSGYVGREVSRRAVRRGWEVTSLSRRGINPESGDPVMEAVNWVAGDATDPNVVKPLVNEVDAVVHAVGLLFDVDSKLDKLNLIVSGSGSKPDEGSTYDRITRLTAFNAIDAANSKLRLPFAPRVPFLFVSAAEAGWPTVQFGDIVEDRLAPEWLKRYLAAKRAVEAKLGDSVTTLRPVIFRPSLIWSWTKLDVLPIIPVFNIASAVGVPFVDRTVKVSTLADAIITALTDDSVEGVQRFMQMDELAAAAQAGGGDVTSAVSSS
eukprot:CAMPEP_0197321316 /NCGR_PEP_ID=MMETSP0891-20130614/64413_1 /TAXON_ID=44058 ORGANISM="Aureoumbra lagunensis, Strain CCMP1510" /NCGR_SAMPLE_ID=MMETSP0891 /ASSEMBLY_ACC=CAM_ASM_000534 /LENGTH=280 /DNA_ID=CAMNT_0042813135 /DNA_START=81 /DNA_END=923 /DNA_ORIENTATION=+